jgi:molybdate transport system ATP-binding protein
VTTPQTNKAALSADVAGDRPWLVADVQMPLGAFDLRAQFSVSERIVGVFGASGCGKTTLLEIVAGLSGTASGSLRFRDESWLDKRRTASPESRGVGYVPQDSRLFPHMSVERNLLSARNATTSRARFDEIVATLELAPLLNRRVTALSGGERQRVALGRALCSEPRVLLLDEPFGALDRRLRRRLLPYVERACHAVNAPVLLVSHDPAELQAVCGEVLVIDRGQLIAQGPPNTVLREHGALSDATEGFENVLPCRELERNADTVKLELEGGVTVVAARTADLQGEPAQVVIPGRDVLIATQPTTGLSARNVLRGRISEVTQGERPRVTLELAGGPALVAELSSGALSELSLAVGTPVWAIFKARSCTLLGG